MELSAVNGHGAWGMGQGFANLKVWALGIGHWALGMGLKTQNSSLVVAKN
ncbi:hypothetical protein [Microcoleus sp. FACHB-68]|nr:hypothetical protein [Microcoleus sp. FACHB-68]